MLGALTLRTGKVVRRHVRHSECSQPSTDVAVLDPQLRMSEDGTTMHRPHAHRPSHPVSPGRRRH
jgi:hypothetical protein